MLDETHPLFPSGDWEGFYTYRYGPDAGRHPMSFSLQFRDGRVTGGGGDEVGSFIWRGVYDKEALRCQMVKHYSSHVVYYDGHVDENGIWGTWYIPPFSSGGFHIWPKKKEEEEAEEESVMETIEFKEFIRMPSTALCLSSSSLNMCHPGFIESSSACHPEARRATAYTHLAKLWFKILWVCPNEYFIPPVVVTLLAKVILVSDIVILLETNACSDNMKACFNI